ncbi:MAG: hypothetical protein MJK11_05385 [Pseudomonadales bacterium]|nr:hypothetical protein [Pseudomonadales bacterium]
MTDYLDACDILCDIDVFTFVTKDVLDSLVVVKADVDWTCRICMGIVSNSK